VVSKQLRVIGVLVFVAFVGCGPSKPSQKASIAEMKRIQDAFSGLQLAVNADMSKQEFSERTEGTLVKIGDLEHSELLAESGLPTEKNQVAEIYVHFHRVAMVYSMSAAFIGPDLETDTFSGVGMLSDSEHKTIEEVQYMFPDLAKSGYFAFHSRSEAVQGLWKLAGNTAEAAGGLIDQLSTPAS
jgi:uncharacterized caspase-like protein